MQFQVPQFIEVEDKIFGPLTFKQFIYVMGGGGASYLIWRVLPLWVAGPLMIGIGGAAASLAFMQWNGRPFIISLESAFFYILRAKLYLWNNARRDKSAQTSVVKVSEAETSQVYIPKLSDSKLHELAWSLDIKERIAAGVNENSEHIGGVVKPVRTAQEALVR